MVDIFIVVGVALSSFFFGMVAYYVTHMISPETPFKDYLDIYTDEELEQMWLDIHAELCERREGNYEDTVI